MSAPKEPMDFDEWEDLWLATAKERGHVLQTQRQRHPDCYDADEAGGDDVDVFAGCSEGYHNGPLCTVCGWAPCMHCEADVDGIPQCDGGVEKAKLDAAERLRNAAPDLLAALQSVMSAHGEQLHDAFDDAHKAISKALGPDQ
mgnify:CR=1 FL=1